MPPAKTGIVEMAGDGTVNSLEEKAAGSSNNRMWGVRKEALRVGEGADA